MSVRSPVVPAPVWAMVLHEDGTISGRELRGDRDQREDQLYEMAGGPVIRHARMAWGACAWTRNRSSLTDRERFPNPFTPKVGDWPAVWGPLVLTGDHSLTKTLDARLTAKVEQWAREIMADVRGQGKQWLWEGVEPVHFPEFDLPGAIRDNTGGGVILD